MSPIFIREKEVDEGEEEKARAGQIGLELIPRDLTRVPMQKKEEDGDSQEGRTPEFAKAPAGSHEKTGDGHSQGKCFFLLIFSANNRLKQKQNKTLTKQVENDIAGEFRRIDGPKTKSRQSGKYD
jgi:hypothetical protein